MKKNLLAYILPVICIIINTVLTANAASDGGTWKIHTVFNENRMRVVDANDKVYCLTDNYLNAYDKKSRAFTPLTRLDRLSDFYVSNIYYNKISNYIVVTYTDYNIDILLEDGTTVNIPNIKNMVTVDDRGINDVTFGEGRIYVASKIGYLVIEDKNFSVVKSAFFGTNVQSVAEVGDIMVLCDGSETYYAAKDSNVKRMNELSSASLGVSGTLLPVDNKHFFLNGSLLYFVTVGDDGSFTKLSVSSAKVTDIQQSATGFIAVGGTSAKATTKYYAFDEKGAKTADITLPAALKNTLLTSQEEDGSLWSLGANGLKHVSLDISTSVVTNLSDELKPNGVTAKRMGAMSFNKNNNRLYVTNGGPKSTLFNRGTSKNALISSFDGEKWINEVPSDLQGYKFQDPHEPVFDPDDPETYYVGTWYQGVFKVKNNEILAKYDWTNSPLTFDSNYFCDVPSICFDAGGNLWVIQYTLTSLSSNIYILPKEKLNKDSDVTISDWITLNHNTSSDRNSNLTATEDGIVIMSLGEGSVGAFYFFSKVNDEYDCVLYNYFHDQYGRKVDLSDVIDVEKDLTGNIWFSSVHGIIGFNPREYADSEFKVKRPCDESNKYINILDNVYCSFITVDDNNNKWVGTLDEGVYMLNSNCTKVLKHFDTSNACFPHDKIYSLCWNPVTKSVFIGFNGVLVEYIPEDESEYSNITVEPQKVTPDFKGNIIIDKLPVNSTVYMKNSDGDIVKTMEATSSKLYWNGMTDENKQLETGKYTLSVKLNGSDAYIDNVATFSIIK